MREEPVFMVPLGARVTCIPVFAAVLWARNAAHHVDVMLPATRRYSSIRSEGGGTPLIEDITALLDAVVKRT